MYRKTQVSNASNKARRKTIGLSLKTEKYKRLMQAYLYISIIEEVNDDAIHLFLINLKTSKGGHHVSQKENQATIEYRHLFV